MLTITPRNKTFVVVNSFNGRRAVYPYGFRYTITRDGLMKGASTGNPSAAIIVGRRNERVVSCGGPSFTMATDEDPPADNTPENKPGDVVLPAPEDTIPTWLPITMWILLAVGIIAMIAGTIYFIRA